MSAAALYTSLAGIANQVLTYYGQPLVISNIVTGAYDPATGQSSTTVTTQTGSGAIFEYENENIDGILIQKGDKQVILSAIGITPPKVNDTINIGGISHTITNVGTISPAGTICLFDLNVRV
jgi:hypothetical protein